MARRAVAAVLVLLLAAAATVWRAAPAAVGASGGRTVAVYGALGQTWLVPVEPRGLWARRLPAGQVTLIPGPAGAMYLVVGQQLFQLRGSPPELVGLGALGPEPVKRALAVDLGADGNVELLLIRGDGTAAERREGLGARLEVWRIADGKAGLVWQGLAEYHPWQVAAGDVDGDGTTEWAVGAWTRAVYDPQWAERPWLYRWKAEEPFALWLGSRLAHPFRDFTLASLAPNEPAGMVAVEATREGGERLSAYTWNGFGFTLAHEGPEWGRVLAYVPLAPAAGCPAMAAVVEPGPALVLLSLPDQPDGALREAARYPLGSRVRVQLTAGNGRVWMISDGHLRSYAACP